MAEQDENMNATKITAIANTNNFFIPRFNNINKSVRGISKEGSVELLHKGVNESNICSLFCKTSCLFFLKYYINEFHFRFFIVKTLISIYLYY
ncbi:MAG: hypothetical protein B6D37_02705 [Sphingobacteriales bacterium UTBCD1]|nr:MAG: hypothetical protein B6D37_02705 [Sphingobacteriales bacterium UTBCD1]